MTTILDLDTQRSQFFYDSGYSGTPSPGSSISSGMMGSPMSQNSDSNPGNLQLLSLYSPGMINQNQNYDVDHNSVFTSNRSAFVDVSPSAPRLEIIEQPAEKFRFRYKSEMHGTHGSLMGAKNEKSKKTFPTVELRGYHGQAVIVCSLYQTDLLVPMPHSHRLVVRNGDSDICDPHQLTVSPEDGYRAVFQGMGIIHTAKKHIVEELTSKMIREKKLESGGMLTTREETQIKLNAERDAKSMNLNQVCLGFQAFAINSCDETWTRLCGPVFSRPINNMKSALTGELKIARLSAAVSSAAGGDDLFLFVEKVGKKNIKVRFFELDDNDDEVWEDWGMFSEADVHHQYAIALRTPAYRIKDIDKHVEVFIQLLRPSDGDRSEAMPFKYKPRDFVTSRKRARTTSSTCSSSELPETITMGINNYRPSPTTTISTEYNKDKLIEDINKEKSTEIPPDFLRQIHLDSDELAKMMDTDYFDHLETDGVSDKPVSVIRKAPAAPLIKRLINDPKTPESSYLSEFKKITSIIRMYGKTDVQKAKAEILEIFGEANANDDDILHNAIRAGDSNTMVKLLQLIDKLQLYEVLEYQNERKETCLHIVCLYDKPEYIRPLINLGANPNISNNRGNTPLHIAVEENMVMCASKIIDGSNYTQKSKELLIDLVNDEGLTPLHMAVMKKNLILVQKLLEIGKASTKLIISKNGNNALHLAIQQNHVEIVQYLLEKTSININEPNSSGFTPLRLATSMDNSMEIIKLLVKYGANAGLSAGKVAMVEFPSSHKMDTDESSTEEDDDDDKPLTIDEQRRSSQDSDTSSPILLFDSICIQELSEIFNVKKKWKGLAKLLKLDSFISLWNVVENPTTTMLNYINVNESSAFKIRSILEVMATLGETNAVKCIHQMQIRNEKKIMAKCSS